MTELTQERLKELLHYDPESGIFTNLTQRGPVTKSDVAGYNRPDGYIHIQIDSKKYLAHRLAWFYVYGNFSETFLDHINEVKNDNRLINLRIATNQENQHNVSNPNITNISGLRGVSWHKGVKKWTARIQLNGSRKHLGVFSTAEQAYESYLTAKRELHIFWVEEKVG
tara:strand:- start:392 stop:895 length:504 start_codon:yes stop_codon:yes gene_type:complete